jgi:hypothetical protein
LVLGLFAAAGLWLQPEWRSRGDTAAVLVVIVTVGAPLASAAITAMARASWPKALRVTAIGAYAGLIASFSMLYMIYSMPDWLTSTERPPGAPSAHRVLTDTGQGLEVAGWFGVLGTTALLAALLLAALVAPYKRASADSNPLAVGR